MMRVGIVSRCLSLSTSIKLINLDKFGVRLHHSVALPYFEQYNTNIHSKRTIKHKLCHLHISQHRNFSVTSIRATGAPASASVVIPAYESVTDLSDIIAANGERTFSSLGLGGYTSPIRWLQSSLEYLHVAHDLPWWMTIVISTVIIRLLLTPLFVITQRNAAIMRNVMPELQELQKKSTEAGQKGKLMEFEQANRDLEMLMRTKGVNPLKNILLPLAQAPIFISYFIGLRRMVDVPVESLKTGGTLWFIDLTVVDPFYLLPLITCTTLAVIIRVGTERTPTGEAAENPMANIVKTVLKIMPIVVFPIIMNFPAALGVYWASSNMCSLVQASMFRLPRVRRYFNIPDVVNKIKENKK